MLMPDVNLLVYAHREDSAGHEAYRAWFEALVGGPEPFALSVLVAAAFLRLVTNPRLFPQPTPMPFALGAVESLAARSTCHLLGPGPRHWELLSRLCRESGVKGADVSDAQHAALAMEHGCTWVTRDGDFAAFQPHGLRWRHLVL